jgi:hypothetical protein
VSGHPTYRYRKNILRKEGGPLAPGYIEASAPGACSSAMNCPYARQLRVRLRGSPPGAPRDMYGHSSEAFSLSPLRLFPGWRLSPEGIIPLD